MPRSTCWRRTLAENSPDTPRIILSIYESVTVVILLLGVECSPNRGETQKTGSAIEIQKQGPWPFRNRVNKHVSYECMFCLVVMSIT